jgi:hypothetical protein
MKRRPIAASIVVQNPLLQDDANPELLGAVVHHIETGPYESVLPVREGLSDGRRRLR